MTSENQLRRLNNCPDCGGRVYYDYDNNTLVFPDCSVDCAYDIDENDLPLDILVALGYC